MRVICLFLGMAVLGLELNLGVAFALLAFKWRWVPETVTVLAALFIAYRLITQPPLAERWKGPDWMAWAIAGAAVVALLLGPHSPSTMLKWRLGFGVSAALEGLAGLALLGLFAKLAYDTPRDEAGDVLAEPPTIRLFLATWMILQSMVVLPLMSIWMAFSGGGIAEAIEGLKALMSGKGMAGAMTWWGWASWIATAGLAWFLLTRSGVMGRIPADQPGIRMVTWGVALAIAVSVPALGVPLFQGSSLVMVLIGFLVIAGPFAILGHALIFVGMFRVLSNLDPGYVEDAGSEEPPATPRAAAARAALAAIGKGEVDPATGARLPAAAPAPALAPAKTVAEAREQLAARPQDAVLHQQLHNLLLADAAAGADLLAHARDYIAALVRQARADQAFTVFKTCLSKDAAFRPNADQVLPLANLAMARNEPLVALRLMHEFDRLNPDHAATAGVYYLSARVLRAQNRLAPAMKFLDQLLQRFPNDPLVPQARSLREAIERLAAAATPKPA